ncbi:TlpA disulfide reductase family protein [Spirochaeta dissipatitropha]
MNKKIYYLPLILFLVAPFLMWAGGNRESSDPETNPVTEAISVSEATSNAETQSGEEVKPDREAARTTLRSIGMTVFEDKIPAPDFNLKLLGSDELVSLSDYRGKVVFLNFWATWCGPCRIEMPSMEALFQDLQDEDFVILAINQQERDDVVSSYITEENYSFPVLMDYEARAGMLYGLRVIPTTYIIDTEGNVVAGKIGTHIYDGERYRTLFRQLM